MRAGYAGTRPNGRAGVVTFTATRTRARVTSRRERLLAHRCPTCLTLWSLQVDLRDGLTVVACRECGAIRSRTVVLPTRA